MSIKNMWYIRHPGVKFRAIFMLLSTRSPPAFMIRGTSRFGMMPEASGNRLQ